MTEEQEPPKTPPIIKRSANYKNPIDNRGRGGRKRSYKGFFNPKHPRKYKGDPRHIVFRSLWELKIMKFCDQHPAIVKWSSETIIVPYQSRIDKKMHRYFVDFYVEMKDVHGVIKKYLWEVKPFKETQPPKKPQKGSKKYADNLRTFITNEDKWAAARDWCAQNDLTFQILTEHELNSGFFDL